MNLSASTLLFFILSCGLWVAKARNFNSVISVPFRGRLGEWAHPEFCSKGHAIGFALKLHVMEGNSKGLRGIALLCDDGKVISSKYGRSGVWQNMQYCSLGKLNTFALRLEEEHNKIAISNIMFICTDNTVLVGSGRGSERSRFGQLSSPCKKGFICGFQTRMHFPMYVTYGNELENVLMYCCD